MDYLPEYKKYDLNEKKRGQNLIGVIDLQINGTKYANADEQNKQLMFKEQTLWYLIIALVMKDKITVGDLFGKIFLIKPFC